MNLLFISNNTATIELSNNDAYFTDEYNLYLNGKLFLKSNLNVITLTNLDKNTSYTAKINNKELSFKTTNLNEIKYVPVENDNSSNLTNAIERLTEKDLLIIDDIINVTNIFIGSNKNIYLTKNAKLIGNPNRLDYKIFKENEMVNGIPLGTWEGHLDDVFSSMINFIGSNNSTLYGQGTLDLNANNSDFWINHRVKNIARRPKGIFMHTASNITLCGIEITNSPSWTNHPFFSESINYLDIKVKNPYTSPTTDGCDPESCTNVNIIGSYFDVGDDCIAIKSGKYDFSCKYFRPSTNITIRNCYMAHGHAGVTLGSENSSGINNVSVTRCLFKNTDRGLRIKSQRGRGNKSIISDINFENIIMDNVNCPFVINSFYKAGTDELDYRFNDSYIEPNELTPVFNSFIFKNIICKNVNFGVAYLKGLPESKIKSVIFENIDIDFNTSSSAGKMAMDPNCRDYKNVGFLASHIEQLVLNNVKFKNEPTSKFILDDVGNVEEK